MSTVKTITKVSKAKSNNAKKAAASKPKKLTEYGKNVLTVNSKLKGQTKSTGGAIKLLISFRREIDLPAATVTFLKEQQKAANYKAFDATVRKSKNGNTCPFYVLQAAHKALKK